MYFSAVFRLQIKSAAIHFGHTANILYPVSCRPFVLIDPGYQEA